MGVIPKNRLQIEVGQRFGELTIIKELPTDELWRRRFLCQCDCGGTIETLLYCLTQGKCTHCNNKVHVRRKNAQKYIGQRYGKLVGVEYVGYNEKNHSPIIRCQCDCGNETFVLANSLLKGRTKSCGCYNIQYHNEHYKDLKGKKFGLWTALYKTSDKNGCSAWYCKCECGTERIVTTSRLTSGNSKSCGCAIKRHSTHNMSHTRIYRIYRSMLDRCNNPKSQSYRLYGGRDKIPFG